jgi:Beta-lactamase inhibitor (BLIP)
MKNLFNIGFVVMILVVLGCNCQKLQELANEGKSTPSSTPVTTSSPASNSGSTTSSSNSGLTMDKYNQIKNGMTYQEVKDIIGREGTETMSSGEGKYKVESYKWEGDDYQFISVVFTGGKVQSKVQANLK